MATRVPHPSLRAHVHSYCGYREDLLAPLRRRELPGERVTLILSFGAPIRLRGTARTTGVFTSFLVGLGDAPTVTEHDGGQYGVQVDLTPLGAHALLGAPMSAFANTAVPLGDVGPRLGADLAERLAAAPGWPARFALLDRVLGARIETGPAPAPEVAWVWRRLRRSAGQVRIGALAGEVGWSPRHLVSRFREQVGLAPKPVARVLRFRRALALLAAPGGPPWAEAAVACGYYDQAHLNREFRALAGCTPTALLASRRPDGGLAGEPASAHSSNPSG
jgi:AraC-like DNA-binding protein